MNDYLKLNNLSFSYNGTPVFEHLNEAFECGKMTVIMSPSGSGKSTLLSLIAKLLPLQAGTIEYPMATPGLSVVFQENRLLEQQSILVNLRLANPALTEDMVTHALKSANLSYPPSKRVCKLSGGEKRRITILRALYAPCDILLLDEPFTGLDEENKLIMMNMVHSMSKGKTTLLVTHNKSEADFFECKISMCLA